MRGRARLLLLLATAALAGCRSPQTRSLVFESGAPGATRVVVAPLNLPVQLAPDLEDAVDPVSAEMIRYLKGRGSRVAVIWAPDAWALWRDSMEAVKASGRLAPDVADVAATFSHALADHADYDLIVFPSLVYRDARVTGRFAQWDGVKRRIRFRARSSGVAVGRAQAVPDPVFSTEQSAEAGEVPGWRGRITGLSIHTLVFTPQGRGVYQGFGGLDLVHDAVQEREGSPDPVLQLHPKLLENSDHVREGVALALDPYLAKKRSR